MSSKAKILYVEDDATLGAITIDNLLRAGYDVTHCADGEEARKKIDSYSFDVCLLDVMLPKLDGFSLAEYIRTKDTWVPIIFLTAKSMHEDKIHGLMLGGDEYLVKPYSLLELKLKIEIFLKRSKQVEEEIDLSIGSVELDFKNLSLTTPEGKRRLTYREAELLRLFIINKNQLVERETILEKLWEENDYFKGRSMDVFISRLRKYLKADPSLEIKNVHGVGFVLHANSMP